MRCRPNFIFETHAPETVAGRIRVVITEFNSGTLVRLNWSKALGFCLIISWNEATEFGSDLNIHIQIAPLNRKNVNGSKGNRVRIGRGGEIRFSGVRDLRRLVTSLDRSIKMIAPKWSECVIRNLRGKELASKLRIGRRNRINSAKRVDGDPAIDIYIHRVREHPVVIECEANRDAVESPIVRISRTVGIEE